MLRLRISLSASSKDLKEKSALKRAYDTFVENERNSLEKALF